MTAPGTGSLSSPVLFFILLAIFISACSPSDQSFPAAKLGDKGALDKLAESYRKQSAKIAVSPLSLTPSGRKQFVIHVFNDSGFSYQRTLMDLSNIDASKVGKLHRDLAQLIRLPHHALDESVKQDIYSEKEREAISRLEKW